MAAIDSTAELVRPSPFWAQLTADQRHSLVTVVTAAIATESDRSLAEIAHEAGLRPRLLRRHFHGRRRLFSDAVEIVINRAQRVARSQGSSPHTTSTVVESLVWRRIAAYETVAPVLPAVFEGRTGEASFEGLCAALRMETDYQLQRICVGDGPGGHQLSRAVDDMLSLRRIDRLRRHQQRDVRDVSTVLNDEVSVLFAERGACYGGHDTSSCDDACLSERQADDGGRRAHPSRGRHLVPVQECD